MEGDSPCRPVDEQKIATDRELRMNFARTFRWFRRIALVAIGIVLFAAAWYYSAREPAFRQPESPWVSMAFSPDGLILAAADSTGHKRWWTHTPGRPGRDPQEEVAKRSTDLLDLIHVVACAL